MSKVKRVARLRRRRQELSKVQLGIEELRRKLEGVTWMSFHRKKGVLHIKDVTYVCRGGLHLGRPVLAIMAQGRFVAIKRITYDTAMSAKPIFNSLVIIDPTRPKKTGFDPRVVLGLSQETVGPDGRMGWYLMFKDKLIIDDELPEGAQCVTISPTEYLLK